jgi:rRNA processing protein Gar1
LLNWVKLDLFYLGKSKKNEIFRAKRWNKNLEKILHKSVFTEQYKEIGYIKEIFGPVESPFVSIKSLSDKQFNPDIKLYAKMK